MICVGTAAPSRRSQTPSRAPACLDRFAVDLYAHLLEPVQPTAAEGNDELLRQMTP